jgi:hypothetical protein
MKSKITSRTNLMLSLTLALTSLGIATAHASYSNGGDGVIKFDPTGAPQKIIFDYNAYSGDTDQTTPDTFWTYSNYSLYDGVKSNFRNPTLGVNNVSIPSPVTIQGGVPGGATDVNGQTYRVSNVETKRLTSEGPVVYTNIVTAAVPVTCPKNASNCNGSSGQISGQSVCAYTAITVTGRATLSATADFTPIAKMEEAQSNGGHFGAAGSVTASYQKGWQSCAQEATSHYCTPQKNLPFNQLVYATTEGRSRFGWFRVKPATVLHFVDRFRVTDENRCETNFGGNYQSGGFTGSVWNRSGRCNFNKSYGNRYAPTYEKYNRIPVAQAPIINACRTIKDLE